MRAWLSEHMHANTRTREKALLFLIFEALLGIHHLVTERLHEAQQVGRVRITQPVPHRFFLIDQSLNEVVPKFHRHFTLSLSRWVLVTVAVKSCGG